ncbi:hypothetical protein [Massilia antarctica]|uniref:hypothetical protein n=1 Tax=Massilia antarctica TaxID=2765360 RepID=UPI0006BB675F|nr:hypothetical protein [Massilia sp. H27-R4]MCY0915562.1 hypothetical protein [Massilia sp. H27-R4]CUI04086.1 hypothetical protein BN2497_2949 [Janthinobacterium sp. CG23_2]CUU27872.1 hypothetical protein BN3177_2949 [Janthinobacterium sp. CG23_2]
MTQAWLTLTSMDGRDIVAPTEAQLTAALAELYAPPRKGKGKGKAGAGAVAGSAGASEAASAALRFGYDDGLMYVIEVSRGGAIRFEEWSDRDCELALAPPRRMSADLSLAQQLWSLMARRQVSRIRELDWH